MPTWRSGRIYMATGRPAEAERAFRRAHALDPRGELTNRALGTFLLASGKAGDAEPFFVARGRVAPALPARAGGLLRGRRERRARRAGARRAHRHARARGQRRHAARRHPVSRRAARRGARDSRSPARPPGSAAARAAAARPVPARRRQGRRGGAGSRPRGRGRPRLGGRAATRSDSPSSPAATSTPPSRPSSR